MDTEPSDSAPKEKRTSNLQPQDPLKKDSKFISGLKKVGFNVWLAVMIIGGALAFITALFLI